MAITPAPAITRCSCSISLASSNAVLCVPATCTALTGWDDVLKPLVARYQGKVSRIYFRADAAFAMPEVWEFLEAERIKYAIRLPADQVLQSRIGYLLTRPVGRPLAPMCAGSMPISAIRPEPGQAAEGLSPRSSGIPENFIPASASS